MVSGETLFLLFSILIFILSSFFFPIFSAFLFFFRKSYKTQEGSVQDLSIDVLIPVHNGETSIRRTLDSIEDAASYFSQSNSSKIIKRVLIGINGCQDRTLQIAESYQEKLPILFVHEVTNVGKWKMLIRLLNQSQSEWVILADTGIQWPKNFFVGLLPFLMSSQWIAVAPGYRSTGKLSNWIWNFEKMMKLLENFAGGPISLHGGTIAYRRQPLIRALSHLEQQSWTNDDLVIPLILRTSNPQQRILYLPQLSVTDSPEAPKMHFYGQSIRKRTRLTLGNIQCFRAYLIPTLRHHPILGLLLLRRLFRLFWAYCILSAIAALALKLFSISHALLGCIGLFTVVSFILYTIPAFQSSLLAPIRFLLWNQEREIQWN